MVLHCYFVFTFEILDKHSGLFLSRSSKNVNLPT